MGSPRRSEDGAPAQAELFRCAEVSPWAAGVPYADTVTQVPDARPWADDVALTPRQSTALAMCVRAHYARRRAVAATALELSDKAGQREAWCAELSPVAAELDRFAEAACAHYADKATQVPDARPWADNVLLTP